MYAYAGPRQPEDRTDSLSGKAGDAFHDCPSPIAGGSKV